MGEKKSYTLIRWNRKYSRWYICDILGNELLHIKLKFVQPNSNCSHYLTDDSFKSNLCMETSRKSCYRPSGKNTHWYQIGFFHARATFFDNYADTEKKLFNFLRRRKSVEKFSFSRSRPTLPPDNDLARRRKTSCRGIINRRPFYSNTNVKLFLPSNLWRDFFDFVR